MNDDVRKTIYGTIIGFFMMLGLWFSIIYISSCGFTFTCYRGDLKVERTPIPTLIPASHSGSSIMVMETGKFNKCAVNARDLIDAWVAAGGPDTDTFTFTDANTGGSCIATFADVQPLFIENQTWQTGSIGCVSCHNAELTERSAGLDISSYPAIESSGIVENGKLMEYLGYGLAPQGHSTEVTGGNPLVYAGLTVVESATTP
jgi:hypothetical protein